METNTAHAAILRDGRAQARATSSVYMSDASKSERSRRMRYEGCAGRAGAEPQAWETAHERAYPLRRAEYREESHRCRGCGAVAGRRRALLGQGGQRGSGG